MAGQGRDSARSESHSYLIASFSVALFSAKEGSPTAIWAARKVNIRIKFLFMFIITSGQRRRRDIFVEPEPTIKFSSVSNDIFPMMSLLAELGNLSRLLLGCFYKDTA